MWKFLRKTFNIELDDALTYPTAGVICNIVSNKVSDAELISKISPVSFKSEGIIYEVEVSMARGGYILICKEIK